MSPVEAAFSPGVARGLAEAGARLLGAVEGPCDPAAPVDFVPVTLGWLVEVGGRRRVLSRLQVLALAGA